MRGLKYKIIYIIGLFVLSLSISLTFAAFIFNQTAEVTANIGQVEVRNKQFYKYNAFSTDQGSTRMNKLRKDTKYVIDNIILSYDDGYEKITSGYAVTGIAYYDNVLFSQVATDATFSENLKYYSKDNNTYTKESLTASSFDPAHNTYYSTEGNFEKAKITSFENGVEYYTLADSKYTKRTTEAFDNTVSYYILLKIAATTAGTGSSDTDVTGKYKYVKEYNDITTASAYSFNGTNLLDIVAVISNPTESGTKKHYIEIKQDSSSSVLVKADCTIDKDNGVISSVTLTVNESAKNYRSIIEYKGKTIIIFDDSITNSSSGYTIAKDSNNKDLDSIICSASERKDEDSDIYLSQLGLHFEFYSEIAVYIRIHIQDAWIRTRKYSPTNIRRTYIMRDQIEGQSPFAVNDEEWYFDALENCIYMKHRYVPEPDRDDSGNPIKDANGKYTYNLQSFTFPINEGYYYDLLESTAYTEYINVQVSFFVDIVQANRAYALWGFDPETRTYS